MHPKMKRGKLKSDKAPQQLSEAERRELVLQGLERKKDCEKKAVIIVERLSTNPVDREWLRESVTLMTPGHYVDVVEERFVEKLCAYPLCLNQLATVPKHQYRISVTSNKVYDLTERKKFCSNLCFISSNFVHEQILSSPLWLREKSDHQRVIFLDEHTSADIDGNGHEISQKTVAIAGNFGQRKQSSAKQREQAMDKSAKTLGTSLEIVEKSLSEWFSEKSEEFLLGKIPCDQPMNLAASKSAQPSEELQKFEAFLKGKTEYVKDPGNEVQEHDVSGREPIIPLVDSVAQEALRRRIVLEQLERAFKDISPVIEITWPSIRPHLKALIRTFSLSSKNIVLSLSSWKVMVVLLIVLLARREKEVEAFVDQPRAVELFNDILLGIGTSSAQVNNFFDSLNRSAQSAILE